MCVMNYACLIAEFHNFDDDMRYSDDGIMCDSEARTCPVQVLESGPDDDDCLHGEIIMMMMTASAANSEGERQRYCGDTMTTER